MKSCVGFAIAWVLFTLVVGWLIWHGLDYVDKHPEILR